MGNRAKNYASLTDQELALKLMEWHSSGGDPIYVVGSCLSGVHIDEILPQTFRDCVFNLRSLPKGYPHRKQSFALGKEIERRFANKMAMTDAEEDELKRADAEEDRIIADMGRWDDFL